MCSAISESPHQVLDESPHGVLPVLHTPLTDVGKIDHVTLQREIDWALETGAHLLKQRGLFPNADQIQPAAWQLDDETRADVDRLFARLLAAIG